ncbi:PAS domain S-box-containing protein [Fulvimarina manganoxydans]|uniref:histidine kinase n=1 Tax=Fulvimarina manganoxydans TaxID=937218 RepID=A0A1W2EQZ7_9HYPH|nr:PAS domain S-box protein [Fulvimarina manganoxydans]SMD12147.1 PAS domain S-box-containing protein [Fulvimarina manganoxydans]
MRPIHQYPSFKPRFSYPERIALLAVLYGLSGWIGLQLAVPPGYATLIWPASGLALAGLLYGGWTLWPGVLLGSFLVNAINGGAIGSGGIDGVGLAVAAGIAAGSSLQAIAAYVLVARGFGHPVRLEGWRDIALIGTLSAPLPCLISASVGVGVLLAAGFVQPQQVAENWLTWWLGDVAGVLLVLPLACLAPMGSFNPQWKGVAIAKLPMVSLIVLALPLMATFYAWKLTSEITYKSQAETFARLVGDSEHALEHRIDTYANSLDAGAALLQASDEVTLDDWSRFVETLSIEDNLEGINGIGLIDAIKRAEIDAFLERIAADGVQGLTIKPETQSDDLFIIKYIEPVEPNRQAVGLDIAFEKERYIAATKARDTGQPAITGRILLVQDDTKSPGFLLLRSWYAWGAPLETVEDRRRAFQGWVYAPFIGKKFLSDLTSSQGRMIDLAVFDGEMPEDDQLIYDSSEADARTPGSANFIQSKTLNIMQRNWTLVWRSTPAFEASVQDHLPVLVLASGLLITLLLGSLLYANARRSDEIRLQVNRQTKEIAARERENRAVIDTAVVGVVVLDEDQCILSANEAARSLFEYAASDLAGRSVTTLLNLPLSAAPEAGTADDRIEGVTSGSTVRAQTQSGREVVLDLQQNDWTTETGRHRSTLILRDITAAHQIEAALAVSEERLRLAMEGAEIAIYDIDLASQKSYVSHTWKRMRGFDENAEIDAQGEWLARVHPYDLAHVLANDRACIEGRSDRSTSEFRFRHVDGHWIWLRSDATISERASDGRALRMVGIEIDITELKEAEAALRESRERFRQTIENAPVGMALIDAKSDWLQVNSSFRELVGYDMADLDAFSLRDIIHFDDREIVCGLVEGLFAGQTHPHMAEMRVRHRDGHEVWCLFSLSLVRRGPLLSDGEYAILQFLDIDDRKQVERLKSEFVATVSHELRTPLTSIRGSLGLIFGSQGGSLSPNIERLLQIAQNNCERLIELINDILDIEKIASGEMTLDPSPCHLETIVQEAVDANRPLFDKAGVEAVISDDGEDFDVYVDGGRIHQVLANLLSNAVKFSPKGSTVRLHLERRAESVRVSVSDEGPGVPDAFRAKIFTRFSQADSSSTRAKGGSGLGLSICKAIIERSGGRIGYHNGDEAGAVFWFDLPLTDTPASGLPDDVKRGADEADEPDLLPRGLHIEADDDFAEIIGAMMRDKVELIRARTFGEARERIRLGRYDVLIIDSACPDGRAEDFLAELAREGLDVPTLLLSSEEVGVEAVHSKVRLVKSRSSDQDIVEAIMSMSRRLSRAA